MLGDGRRQPLVVNALRCNRCGACRKAGCRAIEDLGGEALVIDAARCDGCELCLPLCRSRAIRR